MKLHKNTGEIQALPKGISKGVSRNTSRELKKKKFPGEIPEQNSPK